MEEGSVVLFIDTLEADGEEVGVRLEDSLSEGKGLNMFDAGYIAQQVCYAIIDLYGMGVVCLYGNDFPDSDMR